MPCLNMIKNSPDLAARTREIALEITSWPSVTGTADEAIFSLRLVTYLKHLGFSEVWKTDILGDALGRSNVFVLKRGTSSRCIVLAGHFDTVPISDYGDLEGLALNPVVLREAMIESWSRRVKARWLWLI